MATNSRQSNNPPILRPKSQTTSYAPTSSAFASTSIAARTSQFLHRSTSPSPVIMFNSPRFSLDQKPISPNRSVSVSSNRTELITRKPETKKTCMCSPTNHPGSFRCSLHKKTDNITNNNDNCKSIRTTSYGWNKVERSAMANSLVRIGVVEGDLVKRALLAALIRPSSQQLRRRQNFQRRPSRLSVMSRE